MTDRKGWNSLFGYFKARVILSRVHFVFSLRHFCCDLQRIGEGLMLYHPDSPYISGRTSLLLKVKVCTKNGNAIFGSCSRFRGVWLMALIGIQRRRCKVPFVQSKQLHVLLRTVSSISINVHRQLDRHQWTSTSTTRWCGDDYGGDVDGDEDYNNHDTDITIAINITMNVNLTNSD